MDTSHESTEEPGCMTQNLLGGRYNVQDKIGTGGMAVVYRGFDTVLGRTVAIKTMLPQYAADPSFAARFKQEAQAAAALQSPYIVSVYDWGKNEDTYYIVMEYLRGTDLKSGIRKHGALSPTKVAQIASQVAQALSIAHRHEIIHRDIKPQNIMVQSDGNIKVMDFGIARAKNSHLTADNSVLGTAHYVSPEQTQGKPLAATSDIYSLGVVMYEVATGKVPFEGDDAISVALKQVNEEPTPPSQINPMVDPALEAIILRCMQKDPQYRFQTAQELQQVLKEYLNAKTDSQAQATTIMTGVPTTHINRIDKTQTMAPVARPNAHAQKPNRMPYSPAPNQPTEEPAAIKKYLPAILTALAALCVFGFFIFNSLMSDGAQSVPNFYGLTKEQAVSQIEQSNFFKVSEVKEEYNPHVDAGKVIDQEPKAGSKAQKGAYITLTISKGKQPAVQVKMPDLKNLTPSAAEAELTKLGLKFTVGDSIFSGDVENGKIAAQDPAPGTDVAEGDTVTYQLSKGKESVSVPSVVGQPFEQAQATLIDAGFKVVTNEQYSATVELGHVVSQSLTGAQDKGSSITIVVSLGPKPQPEQPTPEKPKDPSQPKDPEENKEPAA